MNSLLIHPECPATFWSFQHALPFVRKKATLPPLGLLTVASLLPDDWEKRLVDLNVRSLASDDLDWADYAFVGGMAVQRASARDIVAQCNAAGVPVVAGGPLFTAEHSDFAGVDHFVLNEAEVTLPRLLDDLVEDSPGRVYGATEFADVTKSPVPQWELADLDRYQSMSLQYSRGCPYDCDFCNVTTLFGRSPRIKTADQIIGELEALRTCGWRGQVFFADDNLIGNRKHVKTELLPALIEWQRSLGGRREDRRRKGEMTFYTQASVNLADDDELLEMMAEAGFNTVFVGIETPDEEGLVGSNKKQNLRRDLIADVKRIQRAGLQVQAGFIVGFDSDRPSIFQRQIDFIQKSGIVTAMVGLLQAPAGTRLFDRLKREGRLLGKISGDNTDGTTNIIPMMDAEVLKVGYQRILDHIYSPKHFYERVRTFLREYQLPKVKTPVTVEDFRAFLRSVWHLGVRGEERRHYWSLLAWTLVRRPRLLPLAVTLAIHGHHFRKVTELQVL
ncbi:MAG: B12-binding domain-containing radical SAM protein [Gemmatimonadota bacterium]